jgi:hypothetical protein
MSTQSSYQRKEKEAKRREKQDEKRHKRAQKKLAKYTPVAKPEN